MLEFERIPVEIESDLQYLQIGIRSFGRGIFHRDVTLGRDLGRLRYFEIHPERLVFSNIMAWEGAIALSGPGERGCIGSNRFLSFRSSGGVDLRYLNYYFQGEGGAAQARESSPGSAARNKTLSLDSVMQMEVPLPDVEEQRRVADKLDALLGRVDSIHVLRARMGDIRSGLAESLIASAVGGVSESVRIGEILAFTRVPVQIDDAGTYQTIGIRSFGRGIIRHPAVSPDGLSKLSYFTFPQGALALSNLMAWEGGISVTQAEDAGYIASNRFFFYLPVDDRVNTSYLRHFLLSKQGLALVGSACSAGAERNRTLGRKRFEALTIPLPSRAVQDQIASTLDRLSERLNSAYAEPSLASLRPSILNAAFTGQL
ncbi:restriction endonuclease subunit S [Streptomyces crystallinus]|uniref:restriction endonuclease subunit S n=1 Tax=Streptomyces crystallinus TaxID=68191 RepID=UPI0031E0730A